MSEEKLAHYSFLPYARLGLSANIGEADHLGTGTGTAVERVSVEVEARVNNKAYPELKKQVLLLGPGDITGIQSKAIVRSSPVNNTRNFEPNYLPFIEFYEEDFLWRYTPAKATGHKLRPWLLLLVLKADEYDRETSLTGPLPAIRLTSAGLGTAFPDVDETWAWAHVHVNEDLDPNENGRVSEALDELKEAVQANPDSAHCRLLSSRRLEPETAYTAFLVPAFETGRLAGLGQDTAGIEAQKASFGGSTVPERYPYYHSFSFQTGESGDFETLVEALVPRPMDAEVGRQPMDIQAPGYNIRYAGGDGTVKLEGALRLPDLAPTVPLSFADAAAFAKEVRDVLDLGETLKSSSHSAGSTKSHRPADILQHQVFGLANPNHSDGDPVITPPLYGRWHAETNRLADPLPADLSTANWVHQLNLDPSLRAAAGMGAEVVRKNQESYMDQCWDQVGDIIEANRRLREAQLAKEAGGALFRKHLANQSDERLLSLAHRYQSRVMLGNETVWQKTKESALPTGIQSDAFRRIVRPSGPLMKRLQPTATLSEHSDLISALASRSMKAVSDRDVTNQQNHISLYRARYLFNYPRLRSVSSSVRFALTSVGETRTVTSNQEALNLKTAVLPFYRYLDSSQWPGRTTSPELNISASATALRDKLDPKNSIPSRLGNSIEVGGEKLETSEDRIDTIMASPKLEIPAYAPLEQMSGDYLLPNMDRIPDNTISLLEVNQPFIEAYLAGMNHEMARELLWREFPTDQRGTVFQHFWDGVDFDDAGLSEAERMEKLQDIKEMHTWGKAAQIGENSPRGEHNTAAKLVLVIRGELLRRYPNTVIYAAKAKWQTKQKLISGVWRTVADTTKPRIMRSNEKMPMFTAKVSPDVTLVGFDLTADEAHGLRVRTIGGKKVYRKYSPGWFFVLEERAGEVRFGLDEPETTPTTAPASYQELNWGHVATPDGHIDLDHADNLTSVSGESVAWGANAANMAYILYQDPVRVAVHAEDMIPLPEL